MEKTSNFFGRSPQVRNLGDNALKEKSHRDDIFTIYTYQHSKQLRMILKKFKLVKEEKNLAVLDEAHYIKQQGGEWAQAILNFCQKAEYRITLTGTPMPQAYETSNIFDFLYLDTLSVRWNKLKIRISS